MPGGAALTPTKPVPGFVANPSDLLMSKNAKGAFQGTQLAASGGRVTNVEIKGKLKPGKASGTFAATVKMIDPATGNTVSCQTTQRWVATRDPGIIYGGTTSQGQPLVVRLNAQRNRVNDVITTWYANCTPEGVFRRARSPHQLRPQAHGWLRQPVRLRRRPRRRRQAPLRLRLLRPAHEQEGLGEAAGQGLRDRRGGRSRVGVRHRRRDVEGSDRLASHDEMERFTATVEERWIVVPFDARELWGEARPRIVARINGHEYRQRLAVYGGDTVLGLTNAFRAQAGLSQGDEVEVELDRDDTPREVDVPPELQAALDADDVARAAFEKLSFTHRREYAEWVAEAKRADTRERRIAKTLEMLRG